MLLSKITTRPELYQNRAAAFSESTVAGIVAEGLDLAKFDPIPVLARSGCVGGDGHSRLEAIRRLAKAGRLPKSWQRGRDFDVPTKPVSEAEARRLAWTANLSRDGFTPGEEAKVYQSMLDGGLTAKEAGELAHKSEAHVSRMLILNTLCRDIRECVGASPAAGGIDILTGQVLANGFARYGVEPQQQQQLWHCVLKHALLNFQSAKRFIDRIGSRLAEKSSDGMLFAMPANAVAVVAEAKARGQAARTAKTGLALLLSARKLGGLDSQPELAMWLDDNGQTVLEDLSARVTEDADVLADLVAPPKQWAARPASPADARIARQYDPQATPMLIGA
jgi:ParB-like chromosome segregation protein Spo0J